MSDDSCIKCSKTVRPRQEALQCESCSRWQHRTCDNIVTRDQYRQAVRENLHIEWVCRDCKEPEAPEPVLENQVVEEEESETSIVVDRTFNLPNNVAEESLHDESIDEITVDHHHSKVYHEIETGSNRGKRKLVDNDGFSYTVKKQKNDHILWRCTKRTKTLNCPATVVQDGNTYALGQKSHVHPGEPGIHIAVKIKAEVKQISKESTYARPTSDIVKSALRHYTDVTAPEASRPNPTNLIRTGNRIRQNERPKDPKDLEAELEIDFIDYKAPGFFRRDLQVDNNRHLIFYTDRQIQLLSKAKTWYMDGTFRVVNKPFVQLFSIHAFVKSDGSMKQIPLVFVIMSGKRKEDYYQVLRHIDRQLPSDISLDGFVADFEAGLWQALKERFPGYGIQGCAFHWSQALLTRPEHLSAPMVFIGFGLLFLC